MVRPLGAGGHLPLRSHQRARRRSSRSTPPADGQRLAARGARVLLHPHRLHRPLPADAGPRGVLPDGVGRQRAAHRAPGAELLRRPLRPTLPYDPDFTPPDKPDAKTQVPISRRNFVELCERLAAEDEKAFEALLRRLGLSVDWSRPTRRSTTDARATSQRAFLRNLARGEAYQAEAPTLWDVTFRTAVAQAELEDRELPGAYHRIAFPARTARARCTSRPPGPSCWPPASPWSPTPTTSATAALFGTHGDAPRCSRSRCRSSPTTWPIPRRARASR